VRVAVACEDGWTVLVEISVVASTDGVKVMGRSSTHMVASQCVVEGNPDGRRWRGSGMVHCVLVIYCIGRNLSFTSYDRNPV